MGAGAYQGPGMGNGANPINYDDDGVLIRPGDNRKPMGSQPAQPAQPAPPQATPLTANQVAEQNGSPTYLTQDLSKSNPLPWQRYFDHSATGAANQSADRNLTSINPDGSLNQNGYLAQTMSHGIPGQMAQLKAGPMGAAPDSPMSEAIANKYSTQSDKALSSFKSQKAIEQQGQASGELNQNTNQLGTMKKLELQNYKEQYDYQQKRQQLLMGWQIAQQQAKMQILGTAIGAGGSIIGAAAAGAFKGGGGSPGGGDPGGGGAAQYGPSSPMPSQNTTTTGGAIGGDANPN